MENERDSTLYNADAASAAAQRQKEQHYAGLLGAEEGQRRHVVAFTVDATGRLGASARGFLDLFGGHNPPARAQLKQDIARALAVFAGRTFEAAADAAIDGQYGDGRDAVVPDPRPDDPGHAARARSRAHHQALRRALRDTGADTGGAAETGGAGRQAGAGRDQETLAR